MEENAEKQNQAPPQKNTIVPINTMSSSQISPHIPLPTVLALLPIVNNTHESGMTPPPAVTNLNEPSTNSVQQQEASSSPPSNASGADNVEICEESGSADAADNNTIFGDIITSPVCKGEAPRSPEAAPEASSEQGQINKFPTVQPTKINPFINQDDDEINEGYDSEGELMYYDPDLLSQEMDAFSSCLGKTTSRLVPSLEPAS